MYLNLISYSNVLLLLVMFYFHKPHYLKLILVVSYGRLYFVHCINLINDLAFNYIHFIIVVLTIGLIILFYKDYKNGKENKLS